MIDYIASILTRALNIIFHLLPIKADLWMGRSIGRCAFAFNKKRRLIAYANLKAAFAKEKSPEELRAITKDVYVNLVQTFSEIASLTKLNKDYVNRYVEVVNMERIENAATSGRGTMLLTAHFGDWEFSSLVSALKGFPITVLAREQKMKHLNELLNRLRESKGCKVVRKGMSTKNILRELCRKNMVGILSDQDAGKNGTFVNFFGRPTSAHIGPFEIAKHTNSIILPNFIVRVNGPFHKLYLEEYIDVGRSDGREGLIDGLQRYMSLLEKYIRKYPAQWLWLHKRWKSTPKRTVLVLNDGKAGHLNQSLAVARQIERVRATQNYGTGDTDIVVVDVKYKSKLFRALLFFASIFASWRCHGRMSFMKMCLQNDSYGQLMKTYAEFIVSCGSSLAPVNIFMSKENNARNVVVMDPAVPFSLNKFNFVIAPKHDNVKPRKNVITTTLAPNLVDAESLRLSGEKLKNNIRIEKDKVIGLLIGGDNPEFALSDNLLEKTLADVLKICESNGADLLVTTSRRTNRAQEAIVKAALQSNPRCKLLVIANENNPEGTLAGILALSNVIAVSGESISMVSEAVSSGKKTVVFSLDKKKRGKKPKHEFALENLVKEGYVSIARSGELISLVGRALKDASPAKRVDDMDKIYEAMRALI
ncbi:MAG: ELM1/GtrOC1 family putative glycosyltransferase [Candidatus Omnitrophica bacterium]|nr:ELM1/GtrOC1 family putative glycosyltransferase [Candidatus Omnitrophota bacterium]